MALFLVFFLPLLFLLLWLEQRQQGFEVNTLWISYLWGALLFLPIYLFFFIIRDIFQNNYSGLNFYFYYFFVEHFIFLVGASLVFILFRFVIYRENLDANFYQNISFFGGFYSSVCIFRFFDHLPHFSFYVLFLYPLLALATVITISTAMQFLFGQPLVIKILAVAGLVSWPFLINFVTVLAWRNLDLGSAFISLGFVALTLSGFFLIRKNT